MIYLFAYLFQFWHPSGSESHRSCVNPPKTQENVYGQAAEAGMAESLCADIISFSLTNAYASLQKLLVCDFSAVLVFVVRCSGGKV